MALPAEAGRPRVDAGLIVLATIAAILLNYWFIEGFAAEHSDPTGSWISDLGARSQDTGWLFSLLDSVSGVALLLVTVLVWPRLAGRSRLMLWGMVALAVTAVTTIIDGLTPLSCATALPPDCVSAHDLRDTLHEGESTVNVIATIAAFGLLGLALLREPDLRDAGIVTLACGACWVLLYVLVGLDQTFDAFGGAKGSMQRPAQVVNGLWIVVLVACLAHLPRRPPPD